MTDREEGEEALPEITQLFEEFLEAKEGEEDQDREALLRRAGKHREKLSKRIDLYERLHGLAEPLDEEEQALPTTLGRFRILASAGEGGLGQVYLALDPELGRQVALKVLEPGATLDKRERAWILNEARALARLEHPGVVRVFEVGHSKGRDYVVMEHLTGPTLHRVITELRRMRAEVEETGRLNTPNEPTEARRLAETLLPFSARVACLRQIARALAYCHDRGILHRDVKPANVVFDEDDEPRLIDFGLAHQADTDEETKLDITQRLVGSPAYVSPEQVENERTGADPLSDQFSFAVVCYEFLTLRNPFKQKSRATTLDAIARAMPRPPRRLDDAIPPDLERVVLHGLERDPADRYPDLAALAADLTAILDHRPIGVAEPSLLHLLRLWLRRNRRRVEIMGVVVLILLLAAFAQWYTGTTATRRPVLEGLARAEAEDLISPGDFHRRLEDLRSWNEVLAGLDRSFLQRLLFASLLPRWEERAEEFSIRLGEAVREAERVATENGTQFQGSDWRSIIQQEALLCPDYTGNNELRERGLVVLDLPPGCRKELYEQHLPGPGHLIFYSDYRSSPPTQRPNLGRYRYYVWKEDSSVPPQVIDFVITEQWAPRLDLEVLDSRRELVPKPVRLERGYCKIPLPDEEPPGSYRFQAELSDGEFGIAIPAIEMTPQPVTRREMREFLEATGRDAEGFLSENEGDDHPAWVSVALAEDYARWAGGRLPSLLELLLARERGVISIELRTRSETEQEEATGGFPALILRDVELLAEWLCDLPGTEDPKQAACMKYVMLTPPGTPGYGIQLIQHGVAREMPPKYNDYLPQSEPQVRCTGGIGFRVVFPAEDPTRYESRWPE